MRSSTREWRLPISTQFAAALFTAALVVGPAALARSAASNPITNGGFERSLVGETTCGRLPLSVGNWLAYAQTPGYLPARVSEPRHAGRHAVSVRGPALPFCSAYGVIEDLRSGALNLDQDFQLRVWVDPEQGTQSQELLVNWTRLNGTPAFVVTENLATHTVSFSAWGETRRVHDALRANVWHRIELAVSAPTDTATLSIDGHTLATTRPGSPVAGGPVTVVLGQVRGTASSVSNFYYDDVSLSG